ncbi:hypothetical protein ABG067_008059, partial [Albugo candida]
MSNFINLTAQDIPTMRNQRRANNQVQEEEEINSNDTVLEHESGDESDAEPRGVGEVEDEDGNHDINSNEEEAEDEVPVAQHGNARVWTFAATTLFLEVMRQEDTARKAKQAGNANKAKLGHIWSDFVVAFQEHDQYQQLPQSFRDKVDSTFCSSKFLYF